MRVLMRRASWCTRILKRLDLVAPFISFSLSCLCFKKIRKRLVISQRISRLLIKRLFPQLRRLLARHDASNPMRPGLGQPQSALIVRVLLGSFAHPCHAVNGIANDQGIAGADAVCDLVEVHLASRAASMASAIL